MNVFNDNSEISKGRGPLVATYKMHYVGTTFTMKMNSNDKILCDNILNKQDTKVLLLQFDWGRSSLTTLTSSSIWVIGLSLFSISAVFEVSSAVAKHSLCEFLIQTYINGAC